MKTLKIISSVAGLGLCLALLTHCSSASKSEAMSNPLPESFTVDGKKLVMKGQGFKIASKMGFTAKIHKAAFYVEDTSLSAEDLISKNTVSHIYMRFVFDVPKYLMKEGWGEAIPASCVEDCANQKSDLNKFLEFIPTMHVGDVYELTFKPTGVTMQIHGAKTASAEIPSPVFSRNLLRTFIGPIVLDKTFKNELLGVKL